MIDLVVGFLASSPRTLAPRADSENPRCVHVARRTCAPPRAFGAIPPLYTLELSCASLALRAPSRTSNTFRFARPVAMAPTLLPMESFDFSSVQNIVLPTSTPHWLLLHDL